MQTIAACARRQFSSSPSRPAFSLDMPKRPKDAEIQTPKRSKRPRRPRRVADTGARDADAANAEDAIGGDSAVVGGVGAVAVVGHPAPAPGGLQPEGPLLAVVDLGAAANDPSSTEAACSQGGEDDVSGEGRGGGGRGRGERGRERRRGSGGVGGGGGGGDGGGGGGPTSMLEDTDSDGDSGLSSCSHTTNGGRRWYVSPPYGLQREPGRLEHDDFGDDYGDAEEDFSSDAPSPARDGKVFKILMYFICVSAVVFACCLKSL